MDIEKLI